MKAGAFTFILHTHIPYCRNAGRWPHGEEWLHEAASESYLPLLDALYDLQSEGIPYRLTMSFSPVLTEQLSDPLIIEHLEEFLKDKVARAQSDITRFEVNRQSQPANLARYYMEHYQRLLESFQQRFRRNLVGAFRYLQEEGYIEIVTSAATHCYLPLLERDSSIYAQLKTGIDSYRRIFGVLPRGAWLPECGYRPAYYATSEGKTYIKPGIELYLEKLGLGYFFSETHAIEGGLPVGKAAGEAIGPYTGIGRRYVIPEGRYLGRFPRSVCLPYLVQDSRVTVLGRDNHTGRQVWSAEWGYPGDFNYREFHKKEGVSGIQYWRVTGAQVELGLKEYYEPVMAQQRVVEHCNHYCQLVEQLLVDFYHHSGHNGIVCAAYDTELFGHWWFEGVDWIKRVLRNLAYNDLVELTTAGEFISRYPTQEPVALLESSWGVGGEHFTWKNIDTEWMWTLINTAARRMEDITVKYPDATGDIASVLNQAARELLLLQSSDWLFLITTGQAKDYATRRFLEHVDRFNELLELAGSARTSVAGMARCREIEEKDSLFPDIDYHHFTNHEASVARSI